MLVFVKGLHLHLGNKNINIMAIQIGRFLYGRVGSLVYKVVDGKQVVSQVPVYKPRKLSGAEFFNVSTFGAGSSVSAAIRETLSPQIQGFCDTKMSGRLVSHLVKVLKACRDQKSLEYILTNEKLAGLDFFEFNSHSKLRPMISLLLGTDVLLDRNGGLFKVFYRFIMPS